MYQFSPVTSPSLRFQRPDHWEHIPRPAPRKADILYQGSLEHVGPIIIGAATFLGVIGAGIKWLLTLLGGRQDRRIAELEKQVNSLNNRLQIVTYHALAMSAKLRFSDPQSPELASWEKVLHDIFPLDSETPMEMLARALKVDA